MNLRCSSLFLFAGVAFGSTIPVTGHGEFWLDNFMDGNTLMSFEGSNGIDSVSFGGDIALGVTAPTWLSAFSIHSPPLQSYSATIDDITSHFWSFYLGDGSGNLTLFDAAGNVLASQDLSGVIQTTSYWQFQTRFLPDGYLNDDWEASGDFEIGPVANADPTAVPEAGSAVLVGAGLLGFLGRREVHHGPE